MNNSIANETHLFPMKPNAYLNIYHDQEKVSNYLQHLLIFLCEKRY